MKEYEALKYLMGAYFHQDYEIVSGSVYFDTTIEDFVFSENIGIVQKLLNDLSRFEYDFFIDLDNAFEEQFSPDVIVGPVSEFFDLIRTTIKKHYPDLVE